MDNIIRTIVDMDKRARLRTSEAEERFEKVDSELAEQVKAIRDEQLSDAEKHIELNAAEQKRLIAEAVAKIDSESAEIAAELEKKYSDNREKWVSEIYKGALAL